MQRRLRLHPFGRAAAVALAVALVASLLTDTLPAMAQATRTWVSGVGDDVNPCSRTAPCKTFAGAISKTADKGEINVLDPGGFGTLTATKSITVSTEGPTAGVLAAGGINGVVVNDSATAAPGTIVVVLRGLDIEGAGTGANGIRFISGRALYVENTTINGFKAGTGRGIDMQVGGNAELYVTNTEIRNNAGAGIFVDTSSGLARATIESTRLSNNAIGLDARDNARVVVKNSMAIGNTNAGFQAQADTSTAELDMNGSVATFNGVGIRVGGGPGNRPATLIWALSSLFGNGTGLDTTPSATIQSQGNNRNADGGGPQAANCDPRSQVTVRTQQNGAGQLLVTVSATTNLDGGLNSILSMNFAPTSNARVDIPNGPANSLGGVNQAQPANTTTVTFNMRRINPGAFTSSFTVVDECGQWKSFAGGGVDVP